jgi:hypothetical protein
LINYFISKEFTINSTALEKLFSLALPVTITALPNLFSAFKKDCLFLLLIFLNLLFSEKDLQLNFQILITYSAITIIQFQTRK